MISPCPNVEKVDVRVGNPRNRGSHRNIGCATD